MLLYGHNGSIKDARSGRTKSVNVESERSEDLIVVRIESRFKKNRKWNERMFDLSSYEDNNNDKE